MRIAPLAHYAEASEDDERWDLLIIGSGPIGLSIATEFADTSARILVIESGGLHHHRNSDDLDLFESVGERRIMDVRKIRTRAFGGTSNVWSGRCTPFDDIDFEARPWIPFSGWPLDAGALAPYVRRASARLRLAINDYDDRFWGAFGRRPPSSFDPALLRSQFWQYSHDRDNPRDFTRFGSEFMRHRARNVDVLLEATVTRLNVAPSGRTIASVEVASPDQRRRTIRAKRVILCAGGIENARLLLNFWLAPGAKPDRPLDAAGRFLMDHPRCTIGIFKGRDAERISRVFGLYRLRVAGQSRIFTHGIALSAASQRREHLLNCAAWLTEARAPDDPWDALKRLISRRAHCPRDLAAVFANLPLMCRGAWRYQVQGRGVLHKCDAVHLDCLVEQMPDPQSRLTLGERTDRFGVPLARIDWKIGALEKATILRFAAIIRTEFARLGLPLPRMSDWIEAQDHTRAELIDVAHPIGTTRMSTDARSGVVDENCRVHGIDGLYVAGSSVFPTAGHANPTLMALALAIRLSDHIKTLAA